MILRLIKKRKVSVTFTSTPANPLDITLFDSATYSDICSKGLHISPFRIMHAASVHYTGRYAKSPAMRFLNAFSEISGSLVAPSSDGKLRFNDDKIPNFKRTHP